MMLLVDSLPTMNFVSLNEAVCSRSLTAEERQKYTQLLKFAYKLQSQNPTFEKLYYHLLHLFVLNGSRLDLIKAVDRRLRGLADGQGALVLIGGVSGIGKTSLVMAFQERIIRLGAKFISGRCSDQERGAYALWREVARSASAAGFSLDDLPAPLGTGKEAQSPRHLQQAIADWLKDCAISQPLVILVDDLHWADADSLEVLNYLTQPTPAPILFVGTYRSEETHLNYVLYDYLPRLLRNRMVDLLQLEPLTPSDLERFVTVYCGECTPELVAYLYERAEGHPLFTKGLLEDLIAQDLLTQDAQGRWLPPAFSMPVPGVLKQLIMQRVDRLGEQVKRLLSIAAVVGESWSLKIVESFLEIQEDDLLKAMESGLQAEIITTVDEQTEMYAFAHSLVREVLYTNQLARRRKRVHQQIAALFEQQQPEDVFAIAYHYIEGEQWVKAVEFCLAAGEQAVHQFAFYSALQWYQQALNAAERAGKTLAPEIHLTIYTRLGRTYQALQHRREAEIVYSRMRDLAQSQDDHVAEGRALVHLAIIRTIQYQFDLAEKTAYEALKIGERTKDVHLLSHIHMCLGALYIYRGQLERAKHHLQETQVRAETLDDSAMTSEFLKLWGYILILAGQYRETEMYSESLIKNSQKSIDPTVKLSGYQNLGWSQIETGKYHDAYQTFLTAFEKDDVSKEHHRILPRILNLMGYLYLELGSAQKALDWDQRALAASWLDPAHGNYEMRRYSLLNIATDYLYLGNLEKVQETIAQFEAIKDAAESVRFRYYNRYQLLMSELSLVQGDLPQAIEWAREARSLAESNGIPKNIAKSHWFEGRSLAGLRRFSEALTQLEKGIAIADEIQHGSLRWKIRLSRAEVMRLAGISTGEATHQVREMIDQAIQSLSGSPLQEIFLGSPWLQQLVDLEQNPVLASPAYPAGLTQREVEVLQLVAQGATNQQVADTLHISVRTVNTHLTNILNKTGCDNRTAASVFAFQNNLIST
jgi:DNA-binding CsgD family transcriptional regulator/tetratricopeptide (TPR) repeat protein